jgi:hypothetical protein
MCLRSALYHEREQKVRYLDLDHHLSGFQSVPSTELPSLGSSSHPRNLPLLRLSSDSFVDEIFLDSICDKASFMLEIAVEMSDGVVVSLRGGEELGELGKCDDCRQSSGREEKVREEGVLFGVHGGWYRIG